METKFSKAKKLYDALCKTNAQFLSEMRTIIGNEELELFSEDSAYVYTTIETKYGEEIEVGVDKVRLSGGLYPTFEFHVAEMDDEEADEWIYDGAFTDLP